MLRCCDAALDCMYNIYIYDIHTYIYTQCIHDVWYTFCPWIFSAQLLYPLTGSFKKPPKTTSSSRRNLGPHFLNRENQDDQTCKGWKIFFLKGTWRRFLLSPSFFRSVYFDLLEINNTSTLLLVLCVDVFVQTATSKKYCINNALSKLSWISQKVLYRFRYVSQYLQTYNRLPSV